MGVLSGVCPQRRLVAVSESEVFIRVGGPLTDQKKVLKDCAGTRLSSFEIKQNRCPSPFGSVKPAVRPVLILLLLCSFLVYGSEILLIHANDFGRQCTDLMQASKQTAKQFKFAMVTCSDGASTIPQRSFEGIIELVTPNKKRYVQRHGYDFIDASDLLDRARPPSWSKIIAVRKYLPNYDWIFWNDVDSLVTNPSIALEDIIGSIAGNANFEDMPDFIVTEDVTGVNAGMFFVKNSKWSEDFLDIWWNQTSFIRPFGHVKSGDNDALKFLIENIPEKEKERHMRIPHMQCVFNSHLWRPSFRNSHRLVTLTRTVWQGVYSKGDFMVHLAGLNDKKKWIQRILREIEDEETAPQISENKNFIASLEIDRQ
ncbi:hypothetical protein O6H91_03G049100 [Diphasiastrum complanatum]|uniref:Uncharacterized protein n=1 Tax=Diphasiastrum complanatum TaxID=34168 RepID=A0ACC2E671_DIPCM|nr:hypothetical protein O6H91_Y052100 [Diphasiastrum complanatum]KAJ7561951.1 hypothetical protein O6H91_03G049100 [Diphasiastrum complanatum]